uniref:Uncharacterized protein n=1 Tax=Cannabis sativa TaxID=3483 RepID=A0A803NJQ4_CANSA
MVLTRNKSGLHFTNPNAKARDKEDQNEVTSHHKDQIDEDTDIDTPIFKDKESKENSFDDDEDDSQDISEDDVQDEPMEDHKDKTSDDVGGKDKLDETDPVVILAQKFQLN